MPWLGLKSKNLVKMRLSPSDLICVRPQLAGTDSLGQKSCRTKVSRIFRIFVLNFAPNFAPNFSESFEDFSCFVSWEMENRKNSLKIPAIFNAKFAGKHEKNIHKILLESRQSNDSCVLAEGLGVRFRWMVLGMVAQRDRQVNAQAFVKTTLQQTTL